MQFALDGSAQASYGEGAMYANAPHASAATPPLSSLPPQQHGQPTQAGVQHANPNGAPVHPGPAATNGYHAQPGALPGLGQPMRAAQQAGAAFVTGAYQSSGDPAIDRMLRLEAACKRFGSPI